MCTHSRELIQEVESPCLPHDSLTSFGLKTSACLEFLLSECLKANRQAKFWMKIQKFNTDSKISETKGFYLSEEYDNIKKNPPHYQLKWKKNSTSEQAYPQERLDSLWTQQEIKDVYA